MDLSKLDTTPGSISPAQRRRLFGLAKRSGMTTGQLRESVGGSISDLSRQQASEAISRLGGRQLTHEPGKPPRPARRKSQPGVTRMITGEQVQHIDRLGDLVFGNRTRFYNWLARDFKADRPRSLLTAERAGQVIRVLREMLERKKAKETVEPQRSQRQEAAT